MDMVFLQEEWEYITVAQKIGATVIPISAGNTMRQLEIMQDFETTVLTCTPSYGLYLAEVAEKEGIDTEKLKLKAGMFWS